MTDHARNAALTLYVDAMRNDGRRTGEDQVTAITKAMQAFADSSTADLRAENKRLRKDLDHMASRAGRDSCADYAARNERLARWLRWFTQDKPIVSDYLRFRGCTAEQVAEVESLLKGEK